MGTHKDELTVPIALYKHVQHGWIMEHKYYGETDAEYYAGYVRITDVETITFKPISDESVVHNALAMLDGAEKKMRLEFGEKLAQLQQQRANFLALTHSPEVAI